VALFLSTSLTFTGTCSAASIKLPPNPAETTQEEEEVTNEEPVGVTTEETSLDQDSKTTKLENGGATAKESTAAAAAACRWGEHCPDHTTNPSAQTESKKKNDSITSTLDSLDPQPHIPFVPPNNMKPSTTTTTTSHTNNIHPPEGFVITSRVYTDPDDKLAHFDSSGSIVLEYLDCGALGSTTSPLQLKHAYFRHAMPRAAPHLLWSGTEFGTHPQLLIPLAPLKLLLNSGEEQLFVPGNVILLEDVLQGGHKIQSPQNKDVSVMLLTLPQHYHHVGKDRVSLQTSSGRNDDAIRVCGSSLLALRSGQLLKQQIRQGIFAGIGLGLSGMMAFFLGKVAPLWLSVGVGGMCFMVGGTYATVTCGEYLWQEGELALERRRLAGVRQTTTTSSEQEEQQEKEDMLLKEQELLLKEEQVGR
jgi:hypothetical protein